MSAAPMHYPAGEFVTGKEDYGELCLILPADWPFRKDWDISLNDEEAWPIWLLMELGRFPLVHDVWMSYGFLLPNSESHEPFARDTALSGLVIVQFEGQLGGVSMADGTTVELLARPLYKEESLSRRHRATPLSILSSRIWRMLSLLAKDAGGYWPWKTGSSTTSLN